MFNLLWESNQSGIPVEKDMEVQMKYAGGGFKRRLAEVRPKSAQKQTIIPCSQADSGRHAQADVGV